MADFDPSTHPHRRYNPLLDEYILVSPHRTKRPWLGQVEPPQTTTLPAYDEKCYLCPGNTRSNGERNPQFKDTYIFDNDFAALLPLPQPETPKPPHPLLTTQSVHGACDVLVFHPRHNLTLAQLSVEEIEKIVHAWIEIYNRRGRQEGIKYVQIFENKGSMMGCSNPHPHGQTWSTSAVPTIPSKELAALRHYSLQNEPSAGAPRGPEGRACMLCEYAHVEVHTTEEDRVVVKNEHWVALVPWWATWPFELLVLPYVRHIPSIADLTNDEIASFADILSSVTVVYDNLFSCSFAYSMGIHQRPVPDARDDIAHLHLHFAPPLLRSASVRKFLVGFELMAEAQRDLTPEQGATRLRACSRIHYLSQ
ncbi:galactose-1-phosphate uridyl transferase [Pleurotus pulmonarius]|nr:galactose-1-phosphate uridyl transferase [Pleurotus pulmonarius]